MKTTGKIVAAFLVAVTLTIASLPTPASAVTMTVGAAADSFVLSARPKANKGTATSLRVRNDIEITYIRFNVPALPTGHQVSGATLRVYATSPSRCALGVDVFRAANDTWSETTISWNNQPGPTGSVLANLAWTTKNSYRAFQVTSAVLGSGPVSFLLRHAPGCSVTSGVPLTSREAGSNQPQLLVETIPTTSPPACSDGLDNDGDGLTDHPADPGCTSVSDTDETNPPPAPACSDGLDNDGDGLTDHPADPGCTSVSDTDETNPPPAPACSDGLDNDGDGLTDHPADPGCTSVSDTDETNPPPAPACSDGLDNDGDGLTDHPADPGCTSVSDTDETNPPPAPACSDGLDNDGDGLTDHPADPGCTSVSDTDETNPPPAPACSDGLDNDGDGLTDHPADPGCTSVSDTDETNPPPAPACSDGLDNDGDGLTDHPADPGCTSVSDTDETNPPPAAACSDGLDNDGDGLTDHPADPGCTSVSDTDETDPPPDENVIAAAGDIVCDPTSSSFGGTNPTVCQHRATAALLAGADVILPLGDLQYPNGSLDAFTNGYDPWWGQLAPNTYPVPGNHEYTTAGAPGYFDYWTSKGRPTGVTGNGYYSFDLGSWHVIALNSQCSAVPCIEGSVQNDFLEQDLASTTESCIVAYWHHPLFNSGTVHGSAMPTGAQAFWNDLYTAGADVILNGHEHNYQRYGKQDPSGLAAERGIREFIVGTGGKSHYGFLDVKDANYEVGNATDFGVLRLHLAQTSYSWEFVALNGTVLDSGGPVTCN